MTDRQQRELLLSMRPRFADAILEGTKRIELRRTIPRISPGTRTTLYASTPRKAVVGQVRILGIISAVPHELWRRHGSESGITEREFFAYFSGAETAYGLQLEDPRPLSPIPLSELRAAGIEPPQSWRYMHAGWLDRDSMKPPTL